MPKNNGTTVQWSVADGQTTLKGTVKVNSTNPYTGEIDVVAAISIDGVRIGGGGSTMYTEDESSWEIPVEIAVPGVGKPTAEIKVNDLILQVSESGNVT